VIISRRSPYYRKPAFIVTLISIIVTLVIPALLGTPGGIQLAIAGTSMLFVIAAIVVIADLRGRVNNDFMSWDEAWKRLADKSKFAQIELIGRDEVRDELNLAINDQSIQAIIVSGPPYVGKTHTVLKATEGSKDRTVISRDIKELPLDSTKLRQVRVLSFFFDRSKSRRSEIILFLEEPSSEAIRSFIERSFELDNIILLITVSAAKQIPTSIRQDERVKIIALSPLSDQQAHELLSATSVKLDYNIESWIIREAGGYPGILLQAASQGAKLRGNVYEFMRNAGDDFEDKVRQGFRFDDEDIKKLQLLSLLERVNVSGAADANLDDICRFFGGGLHPSDVLTVLSKLEEGGMKKSYAADREVEIWPPIFAIGLARSAVHRGSQLIELFNELDKGSRVQLIKRLQLIESSETCDLWDALFDHGNELANLKSALSHGYMLYSMAGADPRRLVECIKEGLRNPDEQLRDGINAARVDLVLVLADLLLRKESCYAAISCLVALAEDEVEAKAYNATVTLAGFFHPHHVQVSLPLDDRLKKLQDICESKTPTSTRGVGIKVAALTATYPPEGPLYMLMPPNGAPFDAPARKTYADITTYVEQLSDLLVSATLQEDTAIAKLARDALPHGISNLCVQSGLIPGIEKFKTLVSWILTEEVPIPISELYRWLQHVHSRLTEDMAKMDEQESAKHEKYAQQLGELIKTIEQGSFFVRLQMRAGEAHHNYEITEEGTVINRARNELCLLAREAVEDPELFTDRVEQWLISTEAKNAYLFFQCLGEHDSSHRFLESVERIGRIEADRPLVGYYFEGLTRCDLQFVLDYSDDLNKKGGEKKDALSGVISTALLPSGQMSVPQIEELIKNKKVNLAYVAQFIFPKQQLTHLSDDKYLMLERIAGPEFREGPTVVSLLATVISKDEPIDHRVVELLWHILEFAPQAASDYYYDFDRVASILAYSDLERAFKLLEYLLKQPPTRDCWNPLSIWSDLQFWNVLQSSDRSRALRIALETIGEGRFDYINTESLIDQDQDVSVLLDFASEGLKQAISVCGCLTMRKESFWDIAFRIIKLHPGSEAIRDALTNCCVFEEGWLPSQDEIKGRCEEITRRQNDPETPYVAQQWLSQLEDSLCERVRK
jgi:hypothetical protein